MKLSFLIQRLKNGTTLNVSYDFWDDVDFVYHINNCLQIIFAQMNSLWNRFFSNVREKIWSTDSDEEKDEFTTQYDISRIWEVKADWVNLLQPANVHFDLENPDWNEWWAWDFYVSAPNKIKTQKKYKQIEITYARFPKWHDYENINEDVDIPDQLIWALEFYVFWRLMPVFYEQGASLANNYLSQAKEHLENYAANIWLLTHQRWFTA